MVPVFEHVLCYSGKWLRMLGGHSFEVNIYSLPQKSAKLRYESFNAAVQVFPVPEKRTRLRLICNGGQAAVAYQDGCQKIELTNYNSRRTVD